MRTAVGPVDIHVPGLQRLKRLGDVPGVVAEEVGRQPQIGVVGLAQGIIQIGKLPHRNDGAEYFLPADPPILCHIPQQGGGDKVAGLKPLGDGAAAYQDGALRLCVLKQLEHPVPG